MRIGEIIESHERLRRLAGLNSVSRFFRPKKTYKMQNGRIIKLMNSSNGITMAFESITDRTISKTGNST